MNARATVRNPEMAALLEQYSARFNARRAEAYAAANAAPEQWTPKAVGETMIEALRWAQWAAGRVGSGGIKTVALPFVVTLDEHLANGWGLPETAGDDEPDPRRLRVMPSPVQVARHEAALDWPRQYLRDHEGSARILTLWLRCKITRKPFDAAVKARGTISRTTAYALRDRALSVISQGLDRDGVPHHRP
ncbi:hypothetical protein LY44_00908 [Rhodobacter capsulatus]|uniref:hypothetical protein n=1 Tax=Rhodobacter capsulatus TaxID=1061 RepID=UPI0006DBE538|nr:hypothetical protein [Rhodobacter capsulatus]KQB17497.1 hypothetical protein AP071_00185 [Rhodobacter capsulatus]PZX27532.1 hypothetical protein LY44_00908 [Rhodobacter capsulatus]